MLQNHSRNFVRFSNPGAAPLARQPSAQGLYRALQWTRA